MLNEYNDATKENIHILVTDKYRRKCKYCCNNQYNLEDVPFVTDKELRNTRNLFLTGGEPFLFSEPCEIAASYKRKYKNIECVFVYTNAIELAGYISIGKPIYGIDGVTVSIKTPGDKAWFENVIVGNSDILSLSSNLLYVFDGLYPESYGNFAVKDREWQQEFRPDPHSIFRKMQLYNA